MDYDDHLRHLTLAKIAVLEALHHDYVVCGVNILRELESKILALRKELEG